MFVRYENSTSFPPNKDGTKKKGWDEIGFGSLSRLSRSNFCVILWAEAEFMLHTEISSRREYGAVVRLNYKIAK